MTSQMITSTRRFITKLKDRKRGWNKMDKCCGTCQHHKCEGSYCGDDPEWICDNPDSDYYGDYTEYDDGEECVDYERRE
jgi:hypothetical protein